MFPEQQNTPKTFDGRSFARDPTGAAYSDPSDPLAGQKGLTLTFCSQSCGLQITIPVFFEKGTLPAAYAQIQCRSVALLFRRETEICIIRFVGNQLRYACPCPPGHVGRQLNQNAARLQYGVDTCCCSCTYVTLTTMANSVSRVRYNSENITLNTVVD